MVCVLRLYSAPILLLSDFCTVGRNNILVIIFGNSVASVGIMFRTCQISVLLEFLVPLNMLMIIYVGTSFVSYVEIVFCTREISVLLVATN